MKDAMNWPSLRIREQELRPSWITIPNASGNLPGRQLILCNDPLDEDGTVRAGLLGAIRFTSFKNKRWNYSEADDDYVASAALVDHLLAQLTPLLIEDAEVQTSILGRALFTQSRIAGLSPPVRPTSVDALLAGLFAKPQPKEKQAFDENWDKLLDSALGFIGDKPARDVLQSELLDRVASFQGGGGKKAFAVDITRLLDTVGGDAVATETTDGLSDEIKTFIRPIADGRIWNQLTQVITKLRAFRAQIADYIDQDFDKATFVGDLQEIIRLLAATSTMPNNIPVRMNEFSQRLNEFQTSPIVGLVAKTAIFVDEADRAQMPKLLNALGSLDLGLIDRLMTFLATAKDIVASAELSVVREEAVRDQVNPRAIADELIDLLMFVAGSRVEAVETVR